jgi:hypothetical protein
MELGFMAKIQKQINNRCSGIAHSHQEQKGGTHLEFNKEHAHYFSNMKGSVHRGFVPPNATVNSDLCQI